MHKHKKNKYIVQGTTMHIYKIKSAQQIVFGKHIHVYIYTYDKKIRCKAKKQTNKITTSKKN